MTLTDARADEDICWRIVEAVSRERGITPTAIDRRPEDVVDVEAVERLVRRAGADRPSDVAVSFPLAGCSVTVTGDGAVRATYRG